MSTESTPPPPPPEPGFVNAPPPPQVEPPAAAPSAASQELGESGLAPNVAAGLAAVFLLVGGIVMILIEKKNAYVRFYAMQSILFGGGLFVYGVVSTIISLVFGAIPLIGWLVALVILLLSAVVYLGALAVWVVQIIKAFNGVEWEIPFLGKLARQQLAKMPINV